LLTYDRRIVIIPHSGLTLAMAVPSILMIGRGRRRRRGERGFELVEVAERKW
jgi:hypothetical protein